MNFIMVSRAIWVSLVTFFSLTSNSFSTFFPLMVVGLGVYDCW